MTEDEKIVEAASANGVTPEQEREARAIIEKGLEDGVGRFYNIVRKDPLIGPIFAGAVHDLPAHMQTMVNFWSRVVLGTDRYTGMPLPPHVQLGLTVEHFERWLAVWKQASDETMPEPLAQHDTQKAANMAQHWITALESVAAQQRELAAKENAS